MVGMSTSNFHRAFRQVTNDTPLQYIKKVRLTQALSTLDERSQDILASRWLAEKKATLHELADKYGISAERIRQLEKAAMQKLRSTLMD